METRIRGMEQSVKDIKDSLERIGSSSGGSQNGNNININAGGVGVWICATTSLVSLVLCGLMAVMFLDMNRKYDRTQDLLSVIYQQAPWLKPPAEKKE